MCSIVLDFKHLPRGLHVCAVGSFVTVALVSFASQKHTSIGKDPQTVLVCAFETKKAG